MYLVFAIKIRHEIAFVMNVKIFVLLPHHSRQYGEMSPKPSTGKNDGFVYFFVNPRNITI